MNVDEHATSHTAVIPAQERPEFAIHTQASELDVACYDDQCS